MTPISSPRVDRGAPGSSLKKPASAAFVASGLFIVVGSMLAAPAVNAAPSTDAVSAINDRYTTFGGDGSLLGAPVGAADDVPGGATREYQGGAIYYSKDTGAHVMYGAILDRYKALGGPGSELGFPKNDESALADTAGRFNDFSSTGGAAIYWSPQWGASVVKGHVLDAWRQSGAETGPFGYPSADTSVIDGTQTGKFVGPEGTEIQWSKAGGLLTIPASLAATLPGFGPSTSSTEGTTAVNLPSRPALDAPSTSSKWWWIPVGIAALALVGGLLRLLRRKPEPVKVATQRVAEVKTPVPPPPAPRPTPVVKAPPPPAPPRQPAPPVKAPPPAPAKIVPLAKTVTPPPPPPAPRLAEAPKATIRTESVAHDVAPVVRYATESPAETTIEVTYENNAIGDDQEGRADRSDSIPD